MRPIDFTCAAVDDDDDHEPMTVPRSRHISGVCLTGEGEKVQAEWTADDGTSGPGLNLGGDTPHSGSDPAHDAGIYPIFEDGDAALAWMKQRRAVQQCTAEIEAAPDDPMRYILRARAKVELGATREALEDCARAIAIEPGYVAAYVARADIHFDAQSFTECAADCTKALRIDRSHVAAYHRRASARAGLGDYQGAIHDYDEAILLRPHDAGLFRDRGEMKSRLGDLQAALEDLNVASAMSPADEDTQFKRGLVKVMIADSARGPVDWGKAVAKALALMAKSEDGRIA